MMTAGQLPRSRLILAPGASLLVLWSLSACVQQRERPPLPPVIKIGVMGPLSGPAAAYGLSQKRGVELAAAEVNAAGVLGRSRLKLVVADDRGKMSLVGNILVRMIHEDGIAALIGAINSSCTHVAQMVTVKNLVPMITTTSTDPSITRSGSPWTFRCLSDDILQAGELGRYIFSRRRLSRVALLMQNNRYGKMGGRVLSGMAKKRRRPLVLERLFEGQTADFSGPVDALIRSRARAVVIWGLYKPSALLVRQIRAAGWTGLILGADGMVSPSFIKLAGRAAEGVIVTFPFDPTLRDPLRQDFIRRFEQRYGEEPDSFAAHSFDALNLIVAAIKRQGASRQNIKDGLALTRDFHGVTGHITLDKEGNDTRRVELARVVGGRFEPLRAGPKEL